MIYTNIKKPKMQSHSNMASKMGVCKKCFFYIHVKTSSKKILASYNLNRSHDLLQNSQKGARYE